MNKSDRNRLFQMANRVNFNDQPGRMTDLYFSACESIHSGLNQLTDEQAVATIRWHGMMLNGDWDMAGVNEIMEFMRPARVTYTGFDVKVDFSIPVEVGK